MRPGRDGVRSQSYDRAMPASSSSAARREALKAVFAQATACERCSELAATRHSVVFGAGNADADLMFVGEAPGANEDQQGLPFVGQAGKLLEKLLVEIGLSRGEVFIANVLKCRPPGNRDPLPAEIENCQEYLFAQVELVAPRVVCSLGNFSTKLMRRTQQLGSGLSTAEPTMRLCLIRPSPMPGTPTCCSLQPTFRAKITF